MGLSLDEVTHDYVESQRHRLGSLTQSELVRDLLREHRSLRAECQRLTEQLAVLTEQLKILQALPATRRPRHRRKS